MHRRKAAQLGVALDADRGEANGSRPSVGDVGYEEIISIDRRRGGRQTSIGREPHRRADIGLIISLANCAARRCDMLEAELARDAGNGEDRI